jgi:uncharacterized protein (TIGR00251 family)
VSRPPAAPASPPTLAPAWLRAVDGGVTVTLAVQPNAKRTAVVGTHGEALKIKVASPPVEGAANAELGAFLAALLGVRRCDVTLLRGASARQKTLKIEGVSYDVARARLSPPGAD